LLADDHSAISDWLKIVFEAEGYHVDGEAASGQEAVTLALRYRPDIVVMDLQMPVLNGLEAAREILKALPAIHVVLFTAYASETDVLEGLRIGVRGFSQKTGGSEDILSAMREVLAGRLYIAPGFRVAPLR
jgi:DNA-binding NarL/FixJ family response regulator